MRKIYVSALTVLILLFTALTSQGQLTGTKNIPGDYPDLAAAVTALNTQGVGAGGVTLNLIAGNAQSAPAGGYVIGNTGSLVLTTSSSSNPVIIEGNGNTITASGALVAGNLNDAIFKLIGADWVTIRGFVMNENAANTTTTAASNNMTEWGVALLYVTATDGAQNNTIQNNTIDLNRTYQNSFGIYSNSTHTVTAVTSSATATGATGGNSGLKIYSNVITDVNMGIIVVGPTAAADNNDGLDIGGNTPATGNNINNYGTTGTFSGYANVSGTVNGILVRNTKNFNVSNNTITSSNGGTTAGTLRGIYVPSFTNAPTGTITNAINNNNISVTTGVASGTLQGIIVEATTGNATTSISINNNNFNSCGYNVASPTGATTFISDAMANLNTTISNNTFTNLTIGSIGSVTFIAHGFTVPAAGTQTISNNSIITAFNKTGAGGTVACLTSGTSSVAADAIISHTNNNFSNITVTGGTTLNGIANTDGLSTTNTPKIVTGNTFSNWTGGTSTITVISYTYIGGTTSSISSNTITNITGQGAITAINVGASGNNGNPLSISSNTINGLSSTGTGGSVNGLTVSNTSPLINLTNNNVNTLSSTGASSTVAGITVSGSATAINVSGNTIHSLSGSGATAPIANGISVSAGATVNIFNNKIYNISQSGAVGTTSPLINGILLSGGGATGGINAYNNLIGDLRTPASTSTDAIRGISVTSSTATTSYNVSFNSIYLNATSTGANFGSSGVFQTANATATTASLTLRNNIIVNKSVAMGTGVTVGFRRSGTALNNYNTASNNNLFYAGTPGATNLIFSDGTNNFSDLALYKAFIGAPADQLSVTEDVNFQSTAGANANFLKYNVAVASKAESGAENISGITTDYAGTIRQGNPGYAGTGTRPDIGAWELEGALPACSGMPAASNTNVSDATPCAGQSITFTLDQSYTGVSYQWQSSTDNVTYNNIIGANGASYTTTASTTLWYHCVITCLTNDRISAPVQVVVSPALSGTYTIDNTAATAGTNFTNFADAVAALACRGVSSAVVFNVLTGPYNEQVIIPQIPGASSTNTVTFNGNGAAISYLSTATAERAVIKLNGADHVIIDSLVITALGSATTEYGYGIQLVNNADSNIIRRCTVTATSTPATAGSTNFAGIVINSASATSSTGTGVSQCDGNLISGNTVNGGYVGISAVANGSTSVINNNKVVNNTITNFYEYGVYFNGHVNGLIDGNDVSRPSRTTLTTFRGISLNGLSTLTQISNNRLHAPYGGATTNTNAAFGIYITSCRATAGNENIVSNNMVYDFVNGSTGNPNHNGVLVVGSDYIKFYYNSFLLDDATSACTTCGTRGFYMQTAPFAGLEFKNNIVKISRGGTGPKQAIYFEGSGVSFVSNYNDYYIESTGGTVQLGFANGSGYNDLAAWQATGQDLNSWSVDPGFISNFDLHLQPSSPLDDKGIPVAGITTDIDGNTRSLTTPEIGADEMPLSAGIDMKAFQLVSPVATLGCYGTETVIVRVKNNSVLPIDFTANPVTVNVNVTGAATVNLSALVNTGTLASGATLDVTMTTPTSTLNMATPGAYIINASTSVTGDVVASNNSMPTATFTKVALTAGTIAASPESYCGTGGKPTLTATGMEGYSSLKWQQSTVSGSGFTDIPGGTVTPFTVASDITQGMYYRLVASCGASTQTSAEVFVPLYNPQVLTTTPASRCGVGTVGLSATASAGATLNWYDVPTGGLPVGTGTNFTTPSINSTTTYYVAATAGSTSKQSLQIGTGTSTSSSYESPYYYLFGGKKSQYLYLASELSAAGITAGNLTSVAFDVVASSATFNGFTISMKQTSASAMTSTLETGLTTVYTAATVTPSVGLNVYDFTSSPFYWDGVSNVILQVCWSNNNTGGTSTTVKYTTTGFVSNGYFRQDNQTVDVICGATAGTSTTSTRPNVIFGAIAPCESARTAVLATINTPPAVNASASLSTVCSGSPTQLNATSSNGGYTYVWNPGAIAGASPTVNPTVATTYTVTASDNSGGPNNGCVNTATVNIAVNPVPTPITVTPSSGEFCAAAPAQLLTSSGGAVTGGIVLSENFNGALSGWTTTNTSTGTTPANAAWTLRTSPYTPGGSWTEALSSNDNSQFILTNSDAVGSGASVATSLTSPAFSTIGFTTCQLEFYHYFRARLTSAAKVEISTNGTTWTTLQTYTSTNTGGPAAFALASFDLNAYVGNATVYIRFVFTAGWDWGWAVDNIVVTGSQDAAVTWSPTTNLYTDAAATIPYTGTPATSVYALPVSNQTYTATATNTFGCTSSGTATITMVAPPSATISYAGSPYCSTAGTATVTRTGSAGGTYTSTAGLSINASTGAVNPGASTPGTYTVTYTVAAANGCPQFQTTASITIVAPPSATISYPGSPYCTGGGIVSVSLTGTSGGTFSSTAGLSINPSTGAIDLAASTVGTYTVTYTIAAGACPLYTTTATVSITNSPSATISYAGTPYCSNGTTANVTQTGSLGGVYSSTTGLTIDAATGAVNIATSTPGTYTVTYAIPPAGGCAAFQTTTSITITALPAATISYAGTPYCGNAGTANVTRTGTAGGTYSSTAGLSINSSTGAINLGASTAGTYTVTYTIAAGSGCPVVTTTTSVTILAAPSATISYSGSPYCQNAGTASITRTGSAGGTYSSTAGLSINSSTGAVDLAASTPGTYTVTYTIAAGGGCPQYQTTTTITITAVPTATISYGGSPYCSNGGTATVTHTGTTGGTYSSSAGLSINSSTGAINLGASTAGSYTVTYTIAAGGGCAQFQTTAAITITAAPAATIAYVGSPYCGNAGTATITRTGTAGGTYSSTTGLSLNASTGAVNLAASTPGTYTVTYTVAAANGCGQLQVTTPITITAPPAASISYAGTPYCNNAGTANVTRTGTAGGTYSSTAGLSINASTGAVNLAASTPGTYTVTYTIAAANGCLQIQATASITITNAPAASISYTGSPFCISAGIVNVNHTGTTGGAYSSTSGLSINASTGAITVNTSTPGTYTVTYTIAAAGGCAQLQATTSVTILAMGTWVGAINSDWNNAANWCGGIPSSASDAIIPSTAPNMPNLTGANGSVRNLTINNGATVTVGAGGTLELYGNITGGGTFNPAAGSVSFRGINPQTVPAFTATNVTMNGAGGVTPGGNTTITGTLLLVNGNITIGNNNLTLNTTSTGSAASHVITNGTGNVIAASLAPAQARTIPVGSDAASYNPVILSTNTGHTTDNISVRVQQGVFENGTSGTTYTTHVANRMWIINEATAGGSNVNVTLQWTGSQELTSFDRTRCYVMQHNGTQWVQGTGTGASGTDPYNQTKMNVTSFSPFAVQTQPIPRPVTGIYPNPVRTFMNVVTDNLSTGPTTFSVFDSKGTLVYKRTETLMVGLNQTRLELGHLSSGVYVLRVTTRLNDKFLVARFVKVNE